MPESNNAGYSAKTLETKPYFDIEMLMSNSQETRIDGKLMDSLMERWEKWMPGLKASQLSVGDKSYLLVRLDEDIENEVDDVWEEAPSEAFLYNALAQTLCMAAIYDLLPEIGEAGCAPAPAPTPELAAALKAEGVPYLEDGPVLNRRYAVVTNYPFRGACEICCLKAQCPKLMAGAAGMESVTLPGYE